MAGPTKSDQDLASLKSAVDTISTLISQLQNSHADDSNVDDKSNSINALDLAHDAASLIKAHSTKLSLLIINKPFTPSAISTVLRELVSGPLPGLASAIELCSSTRYTNALSQELQYRAKKLFVELNTLVVAIPLDGEILSEDQKNGTGATTGKGSLASTGVVWKACDEVMTLKSLGVAGIMIKKVEGYKALLQDALEELQEWGEEESDGEVGDNKDGSGDDDEELSAQDALDNIFGSQRHIPVDDPEKIRPRLESSKKRLRLMTLMYQAVIKRRFKTLPRIPQLDSPSPSTSVVASLDEVLDILKAIPDIVDELASAFYDLNGKQIDNEMDEVFFKAFTATELLKKNWEGKYDEFTAWAIKFQTAIKKDS
ncbi:hypothetical protein B0O99DRAFT_505463 [Bisporella sp. PMI_857]|nr:hypothetical protein B0O99DRAFT_505463 [Bisporella sp. PMI_857]